LNSSEELKNDIDVVMALLSSKKEMNEVDLFKFVGQKLRKTMKLFSKQSREMECLSQVQVKF
jgi:hypothetical protein